jgi:hypothetical protein
MTAVDAYRTCTEIASPGTSVAPSKTNKAQEERRLACTEPIVYRTPCHRLRREVRTGEETFILVETRAKQDEQTDFETRK